MCYRAYCAAIQTTDCVDAGNIRNYDVPVTSGGKMADRQPSLVDT